MTTEAPLGERNNNPGNLRYVATIPWRGLADPPHDAGGYCRFVSAEMGIRALAKDLHSKWARGLRSVAAIITPYAPAADHNDTAAYIANVSQALGVNPGDLLDLTVPARLQAMVTAIIHQEEGEVVYPAETIAAAVAEALAA